MIEFSIEGMQANIKFDFWTLFLMIFHRISNWWLLLPLDQRWTGLERREIGFGCFLLLCISVSGICNFKIDHIWACPRDQRWKVQADWEREEDSFLNLFYFYLLYYQFVIGLFSSIERYKQTEREREDSLAQFLSLFSAHLCIYLSLFRHMWL